LNVLHAFVKASESIMNAAFAIVNALDASVKVPFDTAKVPGAISKMTFAMAKMVHAFVKMAFALVKRGFAISKMAFAFVKRAYTFAKIAFASVKMTFASAKMTFASVKMNFAFAKMAFVLVKFASRALLAAGLGRWLLYPADELADSHCDTVFRGFRDRHRDGAPERGATAFVAAFLLCPAGRDVAEHVVRITGHPHQRPAEFLFEVKRELNHGLAAERDQQELGT
jgi:hypothetical protein